MGSVPKNNCGTEDKGLAELNHHMRYEHKEVRDGVVGEGQGLSEEDESRINELADDVSEGCEGTIQAQVALQKQQQPPQGAVVRWERFLPLRSLKVLLVEDDGSTRQVVGALLRNCSYEVTAAANGLQAWKILKDLTNHIDLVLTEVAMPCLSGIDLLSKIMNHKTCKNIPVIMMSSQDSMNVVFKCLSKGAVDFLVKPIRKNELKNLWQHVWRRCHSSSGSGSESGIQTQKSAKSKSVDESDNNTGSNDEDDNGSTGLNLRDGSDNGSGTQSSWTKRAVEVDSPQPTSPWDQLADPPDSNCAQFIHPKTEAFGSEWPCRTSKKELQEQHEKLLDNVAMSKDMETRAPRNADIQEEFPTEKVCANLTGTKQDKLPELNLGEDNEQLDKGSLGLDNEETMEEMRAQTTDHMGLVTNSTNIKSENKISEAPNCHCNILEIKDKTADAKELPSLELSLKRLRGIGDVSAAANDDRNVLRHSDLSAFSRYSAPSNANLAPTGNVGSCSPLDNSSEAMKTDQRSNGSSNNNDMGSTTKNVFTNPASFDEKALTSTARCMHPSAFQPVQSSRISPPQVMPQKGDDAVVNKQVVQPRGTNQQVQVQHHHHHYHHHHHHVHGMQQELPLVDHDDISTNMEGPALQCGSSNVFSVPVDGNAGNYSLNGSASGSNHGSNRHNGSSQDINAGVNIESNNGIAGKSRVGAGSGSASGSGSGVDQNRFAQRVAALTKFRQKRKERCFEKKVRYQSRKRLAEQRPRVRGQFVRQRVFENTNREANC